MTAAVAERTGRRSDLRRYQREVEVLLDQIRGHVSELQRLKAAGARAPALAERKRELGRVRSRLAEVVGERQA